MRLRHSQPVANRLPDHTPPPSAICGKMQFRPRAAGAACRSRHAPPRLPGSGWPSWRTAASNDRPRAPGGTPRRAAYHLAMPAAPAMTASAIAPTRHSPRPAPPPSQRSPAPPRTPAPQRPARPPLTRAREQTIQQPSMDRETGSKHLDVEDILQNKPAGNGLTVVQLGMRNGMRQTIRRRRNPQAMRHQVGPGAHRLWRRPALTRQPRVDLNRELPARADQGRGMVRVHLSPGTLRGEKTDPSIRVTAASQSPSSTRRSRSDMNRHGADGPSPPSTRNASPLRTTGGSPSGESAAPISKSTDWCLAFRAAFAISISRKKQRTSNGGATDASSSLSASAGRTMCPLEKATTCRQSIASAASHPRRLSSPITQASRDSTLQGPDQPSAGRMVRAVRTARKIPARRTARMAGLIRARRPSVMMRRSVLRLDQDDHGRRDARRESTDLLEALPASAVHGVVRVGPTRISLVVCHG